MALDKEIRAQLFTLYERQDKLEEYRRRLKHFEDRLLEALQESCTHDPDSVIMWHEPVERFHFREYYQCEDCGFTEYALAHPAPWRADRSELTLNINRARLRRGSKKRLRPLK